MQSTSKARHFVPGQIKKVALAIAILSSTAIGVTTAMIVHDATDNGTGRAAVVSSAVTNSEQAFGYQFREQNLDLPTGGAAQAVNRSADYQFIEQNLNLPGSDIVSATGSSMDYRFLEMNLELPSSVPSVVPDWRVIEQNSWGEDFVLDGSTSGLIPPSADDVPQQLAGEITY